jgi:hypothetical protein
MNWTRRSWRPATDRAQAKPWRGICGRGSALRHSGGVVIHSRSLAQRTIEQRFLVDRCRITEPIETGTGTYNETTFEVEFPAPAEVYDGPCLFFAEPSSIRATVGLQPLQDDELGLKLPVGIDGIRPGQLVTCRESQDPTLVGVVFTLRSFDSASGRFTRVVTLRRSVSLPSTGG